jgi:hypothetical protein
MAAVNIKTVEPATDSINPAILFECTIELQRKPEILLACEGSLWCDKKRIGTASVEYESWSSGSHRRNLRMGSISTDTVRATFHVPLTHRALAFLEKYRDDHPNGDVELALRCCTRSLELDIDAHRELIFEFDGKRHGVQLREPEHERVRQPISTRDERLGQVETQIRPSPCTIPSSRWAQEFAPELGLGNFLLFEYRIPEESKIDESPLEKKLQRSTEALREMQKYIRRGEWNQAAQEIRHVTEMIRKEETAIAELLEKDDINSDAAGHIVDGMHEMFNYASKFVHSLDQSGDVMPRHKASKEDAYLAYTMGTAVVNLLTAKLKRTEDRPTS